MRPAYLKVLIDGKEPEDIDMVEAAIVHQLNRHPSCTVRYRQLPATRRPFEPDIGLGMKVVGVSEAGAEITLFDGLVRGVETEYEMSGGCNLVYHGTGHSFLLDVERKSRTFIKKSAKDIVGKLLGKAAGELRIQSGPLHVVQYGETDWSLAHRLADRFGCFLRVRGDRVDVLDGFQPAATSVTWREEGGLALFRTLGWIYAAAIHGVNYDRAEASSRHLKNVSSEPPDTGALGPLRQAVQKGSKENGLTDALYDKFLSGDHSRFEDELRLEAARRRLHSCVAYGESKNAEVAVGDKIEIAGEIETAGTYGVYRLEHRWVLASGYTNRFWCMPFEKYLDETRPAPSVVREMPLAAPAPLPTAATPPLPPQPSMPGRSYGVCVARVLDNVDPKDAARIRVQFPWEDNNESHWAPVVTPHAGAGRGIYFIPEIGDEVLVAFEQGDPNRPIVLGSLWNGNDQPPNDGLHGDEQGNNDIKRIVTKSGNRIVMDDIDGKETIVVATPEHIRVSMFEGDQTLLIHSDGDINIHAGGTVHIRCKQFLREVG
ncbi:MAG: hypothetical protein KatS3mg004_2411 [Bryobacteraceae bacterium]|nr:MAG: hypothetical protein KatS3mg004_2411 [Bryobacteraceae bacterium]